MHERFFEVLLHLRRFCFLGKKGFLDIFYRNPAQRLRKYKQRMKSVFFFFKSVIHDSFYANPLHFLNLLIRCGGLVHGEKKKKKMSARFFYIFV